MLSDRYLTRKDIEREFGCSSSTITRWMREKRLPRPDIAPSKKTQAWKASTLRAAGHKVMELAPRIE